MVVVWSKLAEAELKKAYNYISLDSPQNARKIVNDIVDETIALANHPEKYGPDKYKLNNDGNWRAFEMYRYRVTYRVNLNSIRIVRLRHTSRSPLEF